VANRGEPFPLTLFVDGYTFVYGANGGTTAEGLLAFGDLPAGAQITSCGGYFNDTPVPVRKSTWGALKLLYR
jgi:hypothetical protein